MAGAISTSQSAGRSTATAEHTVPGESLSAAICRWRDVLGDDAVRYDGETVHRYARCLLPRGTTPGAVLYPRTTQQVQDVVRIAGEHEAPLYPISRGYNRGYGSACAPTNGQVIVDLQRMNRIREVNRKLAYAVIEPGVTQGQLYEHLREHAPDLMMDASGAALEASVLGNTLERGFGHTPAGDHFANTATMEIVRSDGELLHTGFGHYANAASAAVYPYGVGPGLNGLFCQSNFGIVTAATIWLSPRPQAFCAFFAGARSDDDLADVIDRLQPLRAGGALRSAIHVVNDLRVISGRVRYPWDRVNGDTHISDPLRRALRKELGIEAWNVSGGIYGDAGTVRAARRAVRKALRGHRVVFLTDRKLRWARRLLALANRAGIGRTQSELLRVIEPAYDLLKGVPTNAFVRGVLWRTPGFDEELSIDPLDYGTGLIWVSPVVPASGDHAQRVTTMMRDIYHRHGFDFLVTFTFINERAMCCVTNITFDRNDRGEKQRASACYDELLAALMEAGYPPYRSGPGGFEKLREPESVFWDTCRRIKAALDPRDILSPGRYVPTDRAA